MFKSIMNSNQLLKIINSSLIKLPSPINISIWWNLGSMLGLSLLIQIISGFFLSMHYCPHIFYAFNSIIHIIQDIKFGWLMRNIHMNGASLYFMCMYIHIGRGLYYHSYKLIYTWSIGIMILLLSMATAFLGYVLPWGQMSFWGATVITNLLSAIPYIGNSIVEWLWGGFSINNATLNRFYSFHFILPFIILFFVIIHLMYLHQSGSSNPLGVNSNYNKIIFHPYYTFKDLVGFMMFILLMLIIILQNPYMLSDPDNFIPANPMVTPIHIQPEWYFLFAYAILRSIPNKLGGVIALFMSILILYSLMISYKSKMKSSKFYPMNQLMFWLFIFSATILTWGGAQAIEYPFMQISQINSIIYFMFFIITPILNKWWDKLLF